MEPHQIQWTHLEDHEQLNGYFRLEDKIYCGEVAFNGWPMENVDAETFEVLAETQYARDKNHVYYPLETICVDGEDWGCCYCTKYVMEDVDPLKFRYLNDEYARGEYLLFHRGKMTIPEGEKWISSQGKYEASDSSFQQGFFLEVDEGLLTLYGWDVTMEGDTVYFRTSTLFGEGESADFDFYEFSSRPHTAENLNAFTPDPELSMDYFLLHRYFVEMKYEKATISLLATKDMYASRADRFIFARIQ